MYEPNDGNPYQLSGNYGSITAVICRGDIDIYTVDITTTGTLTVRIEILYQDNVMFAYQIMDPSFNILVVDLMVTPVLELTFNATVGSYFLVCGEPTPSGVANYTLGWFAGQSPLTTGLRPVTSGRVTSGSVTSGSVTSGRLTTSVGKE